VNYCELFKLLIECNVIRVLLNAGMYTECEGYVEWLFVWLLWCH